MEPARWRHGPPGKGTRQSQARGPLPSPRTDDLSPWRPTSAYGCTNPEDREGADPAARRGEPMRWPTPPMAPDSRAWLAVGRDQSCGTLRNGHRWPPHSAGRGLDRGDGPSLPDGRTPRLRHRRVAGIQLWEVATGGLACHHCSMDRPREITSVSFAPGGTVPRLAGRQWKGSVRLWDLETGANTSQHRRRPLGTRSVPSPSRRTGGWWPRRPGMARSTSGRWRRVPMPAPLSYVLRGRQDLGQKLQVFSVSYSRGSSGSRLRGHRYGTVQVWNLARAKVHTYLPTREASSSRSPFPRDGRTLASATEGSVFLAGPDHRRGNRPLTEHMEVIPGLAFSPDGSTLASTAYAWDASIDLWDVATGRRTAALTGASRDRVLAFSPDGRTLAQGVFRGEVRLLDAATGTVIGRLGPMRTIQSPDHVTDVTSLAFSPDGGTLAAGTDEDVIYLWDLESQNEDPHPPRRRGPDLLRSGRTPDHTSHITPVLARWQDPGVGFVEGNESGSGTWPRAPRRLLPPPGTNMAFKPCPSPPTARYWLPGRAIAPTSGTWRGGPPSGCCNGTGPRAWISPPTGPSLLRGRTAGSGCGR